MEPLIEHIRSELAVDAYGQVSSLLARLILDDLDNWRPSAVLAEGAALLDPDAVLVDSEGRGWQRSAALEALGAFLTQVQEHGGVRIVVLDDLDVRGSEYLDESLVGYDGDRVLRAFAVREPADVEEALDFFDKSSSHRSIAVCVGPECPVSVKHGAELSDQEVAELAGCVSHVVVSAYDGEGFVVAARRDGSRR